MTTAVEYALKRNKEAIKQGNALIALGKEHGIEVVVGSNYYWQVIAQGQKILTTPDTASARLFVEGYGHGKRIADILWHTQKG